MTQEKKQKKVKAPRGAGQLGQVRAKQLILYHF
ncbi:hypothetical protein N425_10805 [Tannerella sp. oral taxon BU063 isolate Cell 2]|uniref:Uncharacterized protein n=1 Tax=Tannerella sp. oral taxon BU063 isolate Cell 2 TaxID=1411148 RepID=W2C445_9BACT|nr:hypothetical protein N425_10805 [Tannerella sp. oral taxon BU063 isolate Cell 2]